MIDAPHTNDTSGIDAPAEPDDIRDNARLRIIMAALDLLNHGGRDAVTTRAVADAANVQAPAIYRLLGDKEALLNAVAQHGFTMYLKEKASPEPKDDPVDDLRAGWDAHIQFGLSHPALYLLMYAEPRPGTSAGVAENSYRHLKEKIRRVAVAGRLRVPEEEATDLFHASGCGTVLTLLAKAEAQRDLRLSEAAKEAAITAITTGISVAENSEMVVAAITLRALIPQTELLSKGEHSLLTEWLDRLSQSPASRSF